MAFDPKHIVVPVAIDAEDDIALAEHALFAASDIAEKYSSAITLLHLVPALQPGGGVSIDYSGKVYLAYIELLKARLKQNTARVKELEKSVQARGISVETRVMESLDSTSKVILEAAMHMKADLLVVGSHGHHGLSRALFGSVAEQIVRNATIPVLVLHPSLSKASKT